MSIDEYKKADLVRAIEEIQEAIGTYNLNYAYLEALFEEQKERIYKKLYDLNVEKVRFQVQLEELKDDSE